MVIWNDAPLKVESSFHANNLTENEYVTASPAQDCCVIALDWLVMLAKEDTADQSSIPALSGRRLVDESFKIWDINKNVYECIWVSKVMS